MRGPWQRAAIATTTALMRVATIPLTIIQQQNMAKMQMAKPEVDAANAMLKANPNNPEIRQQATVEVNKVFAKYGCNPVMVGHLLLLDS